MMLAISGTIGAGELDLIGAFHVINGSYVLPIGAYNFYVFLDFGCIYHD